MATLGAEIAAMPIPIAAWEMISTIVELDRAEDNEARVKIIIPEIYIRLCPRISASLPAGSKNTELVKSEEVMIQGRIVVLMLNSLLMTGKAIFNEEPIKDVEKQVKHRATRSLILWFFPMIDCFFTTV
jgi:hypothetical protein